MSLTRLYSNEDEVFLLRHVARHEGLTDLLPVSMSMAFT
jgi:hypothetical protein